MDEAKGGCRRVDFPTRPDRWSSANLSAADFGWRRTVLLEVEPDQDVAAANLARIFASPWQLPDEARFTVRRKIRCTYSTVLKRLLTAVG